MITEPIIHKHRPARVMLVEDNHGDVILIRRAFQEAHIATQLIVATSGEAALSMLCKEGEWRDLFTPDLILLDLNLPQMSGHEVLWEIKQDSTLRHIPVVVLSSSCAEQDVRKSYHHHANGYVVKPLSLEDFNEVVKKLEQFWFTLVVMPDLSEIKEAS